MSLPLLLVAALCVPAACRDVTLQGVQRKLADSQRPWGLWARSQTWRARHLLQTPAAEGCPPVPKGLAFVQGTIPRPEFVLVSRVDGQKECLKGDSTSHPPQLVALRCANSKPGCRSFSYHLDSLNQPEYCFYSVSLNATTSQTLQTPTPPGTCYGTYTQVPAGTTLPPPSAPPAPSSSGSNKVAVPQPTPAAKQDASGPSIAMFVGISIAAVCGIAILGVAARMLYRSCHRRRDTTLDLTTLTPSKSVRAISTPLPRLPTSPPGSLNGHLQAPEKAVRTSVDGSSLSLGPASSRGSSVVDGDLGPSESHRVSISLGPATGRLYHGGMSPSRAHGSRRTWPQEGAPVPGPTGAPGCWQTGGRGEAAGSGFAEVPGGNLGGGEGEEWDMMAPTNPLTPSTVLLSPDQQRQHLAAITIAWEALKVQKHKVLGESYSSTVYEAVWQESTHLAVKVFHKEKLTTAVRTALRHAAIHMCRPPEAHLAQVFGLVDDGKHLALVMRLYTRGSLASVMQRAAYRDMGLLERLRIATQVATAMRSLHGRSPQPLVHGELKCSNVLIDDEGQDVAVAGMGLAASCCLGAGAQALESGAVCVTVSAPEVLREPFAPRTPAADVYSFGVTLLEIVQGRPVFSGAAKSDVVKAVLSGSRPAIHPDVPECVSFIIRACWDQEPVARPSFVEVCFALHAAMANIRGWLPPEVQAASRRLAEVSALSRTPSKTGR